MNSSSCWIYGIKPNVVSIMSYCSPVKPALASRASARPCVIASSTLPTSEFLAEAERHDDTAALCLSHRTLGTTLVTMGNFVGGRWHLERAQALYDPVNHARFRYQYG